MIDLSIIIVSFNTKKLTVKCIESIFKHTKRVKLEIIVVDNASNDGSVEEIKKLFKKKVRIIENEKNVGFGSANNQGVEISEGRYVCLLNSDTVLIGNVFEKLLDWFGSSSTLSLSHYYQQGILSKFKLMLSGVFRKPSKAPIGVVGCKLLNSDRTEQYSIGSFPTLSALFDTFYLSKFIKRIMPRETVEVDYVMGAFMFMPKEVYEQVNGFDPKIFMYVEEVDFCYRIKKLGFSTAYWKDSAIIHFGGQSSLRGRRDQIISIFRGYRYFYKKHYSALYYSLLVLMIKAKAWGSIIVSNFTGHKNISATYMEVLKDLK